MAISPVKFAALVADSLRLVPAEFQPYLANVAIDVEDEPDDELRAEMELADDETLFGVYTGTPLTERGETEPLFPDRIVIFRLPLLDEFGDDPAELRHEIARTVIHEIAHHFGIDEDRLAELGWE